MKHYTLITHRGSFVTLPSSTSFENIQKLVGGYVAYVRHPKQISGQMAVNEDGIMLRLPSNIIASVIAGEPLLGDVVVVQTKKQYERLAPQDVLNPFVNNLKQAFSNV